MHTHEERLALSLQVLEGLATGDAFGEALSYSHHRAREVKFGNYTVGSLRYTDDTEMATAIYETLKLMRGIDEEALAWAFGRRFRYDSERGYGKMTRRFLERIVAGDPWRTVSEQAFGSGSYGNGSAMRVAPVGGYFFDDLQAVVRMATASARVTHFHPEGIAGAVAVAVAAATAVQKHESSCLEAAELIWDNVCQAVATGRTADGIRTARNFPSNTPAADVARIVGCGFDVTTMDTVPFCIWNACRCLSDYREAILSTVEVGGDCDTNCAIVGGIVAGYASASTIPEEWLRIREPLRFQ